MFQRKNAAPYYPSDMLESIVSNLQENSQNSCSYAVPEVHIKNIPQLRAWLNDHFLLHSYSSNLIGRDKYVDCLVFQGTKAALIEKIEDIVKSSSSAHP